MADKDTPIYDKTRMRGTTWVDATRVLFNMGSELEEQVDGINVDQIKQDLADEITNRQNADTQLGNRIDTLGTQVNQNKSDITQIKETINQIEDNATALGASVAELQTDVIEAQADIEGIKTSLVSDVITKGGITTGTIVVEIEREDGTKITAEDFNYGKPTSMELLQGSSEGMMKAHFTLSDGTTIQSNDFQVLEMVTGDLYITSFTFKNGSSQGKISADIGLSDGRTLEANDFQLPTDPQVTQNIASLLSRMTAVEEKNSQQDTELSSLDARVKAIEDTPGVGKFELGKLGTIMGSSDDGKIGANPDGTGSVNGWDLVATKDELADYLTIVEAEADYLKKTDAESTYAKKTDVSAIGIKTSGNKATVNGKSANIVNSISGRVDENNNLILNVNGVESGGIPLPKSYIKGVINLNDTISSGYSNIQTVNGSITPASFTPAEGSYNAIKGTSMRSLLNTVVYLDNELYPNREKYGIRNKVMDISLRTLEINQGNYSYYNVNQIIVDFTNSTFNVPYEDGNYNIPMVIERGGRIGDLISIKYVNISVTNKIATIQNSIAIEPGEMIKSDNYNITADDSYPFDVSFDFFAGIKI